MPKHAPDSANADTRGTMALAKAIHRMATACEQGNRLMLQMARAAHEQGLAIKAHAESADKLVAAVVELLNEPEPVVVASDTTDQDGDPDKPTHYLSGKPINGSH